MAEAILPRCVMCGWCQKSRRRSTLEMFRNRRLHGGHKHFRQARLSHQFLGHRETIALDQSMLILIRAPMLLRRTAPTLLQTRISRSATPSPRTLYLPLNPRPRPYTTTLPHLATPMAAPADTQTATTAETSTSGVTCDSLSATLKQKLSAEHVEIEDMSGGCGQAFSALIVSSQFDKKSLLQRHRLVNSALKEEIAAIHAWTPRCLTPEQWRKEKGGE